MPLPISYKDAAEDGSGGSSHGGSGNDASAEKKVVSAPPRAPGMKYKHYSPRARVVLYEAGCRDGADGIAVEEMQRVLLPRPDGSSALSSPNGAGVGAAAGDGLGRIGTIRTRRWKRVGGLRGASSFFTPGGEVDAGWAATNGEEAPFQVREGEVRDDDGRPVARILDIDLGDDTRGIAQGLFSALRELDRRNVDTIFVDGISDGDDIAAAVMNRLRKAASEIRA